MQISVWGFSKNRAKIDMIYNFARYFCDIFFSSQLCSGVGARQAGLGALVSNIYTDKEPESELWADSDQHYI